MNHQDHIDSLLIKYLSLLDEYTSLRGRLSALQTDVFQNIARANFSAERGRRYGQDHYDDRMKATRTLDLVWREEEGLPSIAVKSEALPSRKPGNNGVPETEDRAEPDDDTHEPTNKGGETVQHMNKDPIKWFGILTPQSIRNAQAASIESVEQIIPKLITVNAQMLNVEIGVRRARKRKAKAEMAAEKGSTDITVPESGLIEAS